MCLLKNKSMMIKNIAIDEMNFLHSRCQCTGCATADIPTLDQYDFETLEEYQDYLTNEPKCFTCQDKGYYTEGEFDNQRDEVCYCRIGWTSGITEDDLIQAAAE